MASSYDAYQIFDASVIDDDNDAKIATDLAWASDAVRDAALPVLHSAGMSKSQTTAQEAAEWLNTDSHLTSALSAQLARSLQSSGVVSVALNAGKTAELPCGYWLIVADDDAISERGRHRADHGPGGRQCRHRQTQGRDAKVSSTCWRTAPPPGRRPPTPRSPTTCTGASLPRSRRGSRPRRLCGAVRRHHERGARPSKVAASMRVYVAAGADGGFRRRLGRKDGRAGTEPAKGWTDITAQCRVSVDGKTFTVRAPAPRRCPRRPCLAAASRRGPAVSHPPTHHHPRQRHPRGLPVLPASLCRPVRRRRLSPVRRAMTRALHLGLALHQARQRRRQAACRAVLSIADDRGRTLAADGTWDAEGKPPSPRARTAA